MWKSCIYFISLQSIQLLQVDIKNIFIFVVKSKSVDATLANILEGNVPYTPLTSEEIQAEKRKQLEKRRESANQQVSRGQEFTFFKLPMLFFSVFVELLSETEQHKSSMKYFRALV